MTREQATVELIRRWSPFLPMTQYSPFIDEEYDNIIVDYYIDGLRRIEAWVSNASPEWFDRLLDLVTDRPDLDFYRNKFQEPWEEDVDEETWANCLKEALAIWGRRDIEFVLNRIGPLLMQPHLRKTLLEVVASINAPMDFPYKACCLPWLRPVVERARELEEDEILPLVSALNNIKGEEARGLLLSLKETLPSQMFAARKRLESGILYQAKLSA